MQVQPPTRALQMRRAQEEHLEPPQLSRFLDWLTQASPAILVRPQALASTAEAGADGKDAEMGEWICQVALASTSAERSVRTSGPSSGTPLGPSLVHKSYHTFALDFKFSPPGPFCRIEGCLGW